MIVFFFILNHSQIDLINSLPWIPYLCKIILTTQNRIDSYCLRSTLLDNFHFKTSLDLLKDEGSIKQEMWTLSVVKSLTSPSSYSPIIKRREQRLRVWWLVQDHLQQCSGKAWTTIQFSDSYSDIFPLYYPPPIPDASPQPPVFLPMQTLPKKCSNSIQKVFILYLHAWPSGR